MSNLDLENIIELLNTEGINSKEIVIEMIQEELKSNNITD